MDAMGSCVSKMPANSPPTFSRRINKGNTTSLKLRSKTVKRQAGIVEGMRWLAGRPRRVVDFLLFQIWKRRSLQNRANLIALWGDLFYPRKFNTTSLLKVFVVKEAGSFCNRTMVFRGFNC